MCADKETAKGKIDRLIEAVDRLTETILFQQGRAYPRAPNELPK